MSTLPAIDVYVLLKGKSEKGIVTFHGITVSEDAAKAWAANSTCWYYPFGTENPGVYSAAPIKDGE